MYLVDFAVIFSSFDRKIIWRVMEHDGAPKKIIRLIKAFYQHTLAIYMGKTPSK